MTRFKELNRATSFSPCLGRSSVQLGSTVSGRISLDMLKRDFAVVFSIVAAITLAEVTL